MQRSVQLFSASVRPMLRTGAAPVSHMMCVKPGSVYGPVPAPAARTFCASSTAAPTYTVTDIAEPEAGAVGSNAAPGLAVAEYTIRRVQGHPKKFLHLVRQVRGLSAVEAMAQLSFSGKKRGVVLAHAVKRACQKADFYSDLRPEDCLVAEMFTGQDGSPLKKIMWHSRGRFGERHKVWCRVTVRLREMTAEEKATANRFKKSAPRILKADMPARAY